MSAVMSARGRSFSPARLGVYALLLSAALFFLLPLYVMVTTSLKPMEEIRAGIRQLAEAF